MGSAGPRVKEIQPTPPETTRRHLLAFCLVLLVYLALLLPTLSRPGIHWDEQVDLDISRSYLAGSGDWFHGSTFDGSQGRLPMYSVALLFSLLRTGGLMEARGVSCLLGALTLLAVYLYGRIFLDSRRGLLACLLLATSPFFLSFARIALTESDLFLTCALSWFLVCVSTLMRKRTVGACLATAVSLGLAISSKFSALGLIPVGMLAMVLSGAGGRRRDPRSTGSSGAVVPLAGTALLLLGIAEAWWVIWRKGGGIPGPVIAGTWFTLAALYVAIAAWQIRRRNERLEAGEAGIFVGGYAVATFMLIPPVHTTNPGLLLELARRFWHGAPRSLSFIYEMLAFYGGCVVFKSSPWIGAGMLLSILTALAGWKLRPEIRAPIVIFLAYLSLLLTMPIAQTFYMVPLLPLLAILASDQLFRLWGLRPRAAGAVALAGFSLLGADLVRCYPDYNLNGFQYLGARRLAGRSTVGYRGIVQVTTDGVQQALEWTMSRAGAGRTVVTYITASHIVRAVCPHPAFRIENGLARPAEVLREADYVVIGMNAEIADDWGPPPAGGEIYRAPYDENYLKQNFRRVFVVRRAFRFQVASVWERRAGNLPSAPASEDRSRGDPAPADGYSPPIPTAGPAAGSPGRRGTRTRCLRVL